MTKRGHEAPHSDNTNEPNLFSSIPSPEPSVTKIEVIEAGEEATPPKPLDDIMSEHEARVAERAARWQQLTDSNWPPGRIDEQLDKEFPDLISVEESDRKDSKAVARNANPASSVHTPRPYRAKFKDTTDYVTRQLKDI